MKRIFFIILACFFANAAIAQTQMYKRFSAIEGVKSVYIADVDKLTGCTGCGCTNLIGDNLKQLLTSDIDLKRIKTIVLLKSTNDDVKNKMRAETSKIIGEGSYEMLLTSNDKGESVSIYKSTTGDREILIVSDEANDFTLTQLLGNFAKQ